MTGSTKLSVLGACVECLVATSAIGATDQECAAYVA